MGYRGSSIFVMRTLLLGLLLLSLPTALSAQRHGGGGTGGGFGLGGISRPDGVDERDSLKDFHQVVALQASSQQVADFQAFMQNLDTAKAASQPFLQPSGKELTPDQFSPLDHALDALRTGNKKFQDGFSAAQKAGLKEIQKRLGKADSDLEQEQKRLSLSLEAKATAPEITAHAESLDKALTEFSNSLLAIGREMSITLASGKDLTFTLPQVKTPVRFAGRTADVTVSGVLSQTAAESGQRTFKVNLLGDLSDVQLNITEILRAQIESPGRCGERLAVQQAILKPSTPASLLMLRLHFERWSCGATSTELAEGNGSVEIKLTPLIDSSNNMKVDATFGRIDASGMMGDSLRSGSLGDDLRDKVADVILSAARTASDFKISLPSAVRNSATIQSVKFQDYGVGGFAVVLGGQLQISNEQADLLASQLNQALAAQRTPPPQ
jgi:hypothetical protein